MKINLGKKRICVACANKFYDLGEETPVCSKCGHVHGNVEPIVAKIDRMDASVIDAIMQARADKLASSEMRTIHAQAVEDIDDLALMDDDIQEEDHHHFEMESDGDASEYMHMVGKSLIDEVDDGDSYDERLDY